MSQKGKGMLLDKTIREQREEELKSLPSKELRRLVYKKRAGRHPAGRCTVRMDAFIAKKILCERKEKAARRRK